MLLLEDKSDLPEGSYEGKRRKSLNFTNESSSSKTTIVKEAGLNVPHP